MTTKPEYQRRKRQLENHRAYICRRYESVWQAPDPDRDHLLALALGFVDAVDAGDADLPPERATGGPELHPLLRER